MSAILACDLRVMNLFENVIYTLYCDIRVTNLLGYAIQRVYNLSVSFPSLYNFVPVLQEPRYPWAISVVFGLAATVAALSLLPLWETLNTCLPDTVAQLEAMQLDGDPNKPSRPDTPNRQLATQ